ncbi:MAG: translation elongation factor Ts [Alphaproteobacteria bacterium]|nr:translation elongation factor Ts [Alphaproteobacteria bacterium]MBL0717907.1 translation elongation factor Ts [Alphaproteobacteria bacterium]
MNDMKKIQELRFKTSAGMMDCKKALDEANGDIDTAIDFLRKNGVIKAAKKGGRIASSGSIALGMADDNSKAFMFELNCETDFVKKNERFKETIEDIVKIQNTKWLSDENLVEDTKDIIVETTSIVSENVKLRRSTILEGDKVFAYIHDCMIPEQGRIGVLVSIKLNGEEVEGLEELGEQIAMHISAQRPEAVSREELSKERIQKEVDFITTELNESEKPQEVKDKMLSGRIEKFYADVVLLDQTFIMDTSKSIKDVLDGHNISVVDFVRWEVGEEEN